MYITLLKFDYFFFLGFTVQFVVIVVRSGLNSHFTLVEFALTVAVIPITIIILVCAAWTTRRENKTGMYCIIVCFNINSTMSISKRSNFSIVPIHRRPRILPLQARPNVSAKQGEPVPPGAKITHDICHHHDHPYYPHNQQRHTLHAQLQ